MIIFCCFSFTFPLSLLSLHSSLCSSCSLLSSSRQVDSVCSESSVGPAVGSGASSHNRIFGFGWISLHSRVADRGSFQMVGQAGVGSFPIDSPQDYQN
jgi:hypothetical protein